MALPNPDDTWPGEGPGWDETYPPYTDKGDIPFGATSTSAQSGIDAMMAQLKAEAKRLGITEEGGWGQDLLAASTNQGGNVNQAFADIMAQQQRRAASTSDRVFDSQSGYYNNDASLNAAGQAQAKRQGLNTSGYYSGSIPAGLRPVKTISTAPGQWKTYPASSTVANTSPTFTDPPSRLIEDYALDRFQQLQNPNKDSGTAMFEAYAKELVNTLKMPVNSPQDEAVIKGRAVSSIEGERSATKARWMEELSRRGIQPSSGIALDGILKIDEHFNQARSAFEREFAISAIDQTRQQRQQVLSTLGTLAGSEEGRLDKGLTYATIPYELQNNAFQRNLQAVGAAGSPSSLLQQALMLAQATQNDTRLSQQDRAAQMAAIIEFIEGLGG